MCCSGATLIRLLPPLPLPLRTLVQRNSTGRASQQTRLETDGKEAGGASAQADVGPTESLTLRMPSGVNQICPPRLQQKALCCRPGVRVCISSESVGLVDTTAVVQHFLSPGNKGAPSLYIWDSFSVGSHERDVYCSLRHAAIFKHTVKVGFNHCRSQPALGASGVFFGSFCY